VFQEQPSWLRRVGKLQIIIAEQKSNHLACSVRIVIAAASPFEAPRNRTMICGPREKEADSDSVLIELSFSLVRLRAE
jgi:hypothetical protein